MRSEPGCRLGLHLVRVAEASPGHSRSPIQAITVTKVVTLSMLPRSNYEIPTGTTRP